MKPSKTYTHGANDMRRYAIATLSALIHVRTPGSRNYDNLFATEKRKADTEREVLNDALERINSLYVDELMELFEGEEAARLKIEQEGKA